MRALPADLILRLAYQWPLKVTALLIATTLWVYVLNQQNPIVTREFAIPVQAVNLPKDVELLSITPDKVDVTLRGRASLLSRSPAPVLVRTDLSGGSVGGQDVPVQVASRPPGIDVVSLGREYVRVRLDLSVSTSRAVIVETPGLTAEGYRAYAASTQPATVSVVGPTSMVQRVAKVVAILDISGLSASVSQLVKVEPRDEVGLAVPGVRVEPDTVRVVVPIRPVNTKLLPIWPDVGGPPAGYRVRRLSVRPTCVVVSASPEVLRGLQTVRTEPIDIRDLRGTRAFSVRLRVPNGVSILGPASAQVTVGVASLPGPTAEPDTSPEEGPGSQGEPPVESPEAPPSTGPGPEEPPSNAVPPGESHGAAGSPTSSQPKPTER